MSKKAWSAKRERQYAHIGDSLPEGGQPEPVAQQIAAQVVNKQRVHHRDVNHPFADGLTRALV